MFNEGNKASVGLKVSRTMNKFCRIQHTFDYGKFDFKIKVVDNYALYPNGLFVFNIVFIMLYAFLQTQVLNNSIMCNTIKIMDLCSGSVIRTRCYCLFWEKRREKLQEG